MLTDKEIRQTIADANRAFHEGDAVMWHACRGLLELMARREQWATEDKERAEAVKATELDEPIPYTLTPRAALELGVPGLADMGPQLRALRAEAIEAGDERQAELCRVALEGCTQALIRCTLVLHEARSR